LEPAEAEEISDALVKAALEPTVFSEEQVLFTHSHSSVGPHTHPVGGPYVHDGIEIEDGPVLSHHNTFTIDLSVEVDCSGGGIIVVDAAAVGEGNPLVQAGHVDYDIGQDATACLLDVDSGASALLALESPPYPTGETHVEFDGSSSARIWGMLTGGLAWEAESKAGECELDLTFEATGSSVLEITDVPVEGTLCGLPIEMSVGFER